MLTQPSDCLKIIDYPQGISKTIWSLKSAKYEIKLKKSSMRERKPTNSLVNVDTSCSNGRLAVSGQHLVSAITFETRNAFDWLRLIHWETFEKKQCTIYLEHNLVLRQDSAQQTKYPDDPWKQSGSWVRIRTYLVSQGWASYFSGVGEYSTEVVCRPRGTKKCPPFQSTHITRKAQGLRFRSVRGVTNSSGRSKTRVGDSGAGNVIYSQHIQ